jgi:hypothetical protein
MLPLVPVLALLGALALAGAAGRPGVRFLALTLAGWSAVVAVILWRDPHAANDCALLLARSGFAEGAAYIPDLYVRSWTEAPPGTAARLAAWLALMGALGCWLRRCAATKAGASAPRTLVGVAALLLATAFVLERWPVTRRAPRFDGTVDLGAGVTAFVSGAARVEDGHVRARSGRVEVLVRSRESLAALEVQAEGEGVMNVPGRPATVLPGRAVAVELPLQTLRTLVGRRGARETLSRQRLELSRAGDVVLRLRSPVRRSDGSAR